MVDSWGEGYAIASCYNAMRLGGGIFTLVRLNLKEMVMQLSDGSATDVLERVIPALAPQYVEIINSRARFIVEEVGWFEHNWWVKEGLIEPDKFTAYAGIFGLAEAVNWLMEQSGNGAQFGADPAANALAQEIIARIEAELEQCPADYCSGWHSGRVNCHAQVGINTDVDVTPGVRVPSGDEPALYEHILCEAPLHANIPGGVSTILEFDQTAQKNPQALLDIVKGAMDSGTRTLSIGGTDAEFIRVTGYLVRRSDLERFREQNINRHSSAALGAGFFETKPNHLHRRERKV
jgi:YjjI family glycine radical enzyme